MDCGRKIVTVRCFKKVVVADTIAPFVDYMYADYDLHGYQGGTLIILVVLYAIQLYADFFGLLRYGERCRPDVGI